ncbi:MAG: DUF4202 domain-containing protein [Myxococcota bacterium]|nr:DUF4202 domain-containing protein [Myxococcota bacterium]
MRAGFMQPTIVEPVATLPALARRPVLSAIEIRVDGAGGIDVGRIQKAFPTVHVHVGREGSGWRELARAARARSGLASSPGAEVADVRFEDWHAPTFDFWAFDRLVDARVDAGRVLALRSPARHASRFTHEVLTRAQRRIERRNAQSRDPLFDRVLEAHRSLHDLERPLVRADYDHALDCWQWALRLEASASMVCQLATLLHDVERLESEADQRIEQHAPDYREYKEAHARGGAPIAAALVRGSGGDESLVRGVAELVAKSETPGACKEVALINDADALSFFSLNSPGFVDYFGAAHARRKVAYTIARMTARALAELPRIRLRSDVARLVSETLDAPIREIETVG